MERFTHSGIILKRPYLVNRRSVPESEISGLDLIQGGIKLVDLDTSKPGGTVFEKQVDDSGLGIQKIRVVKTTKPYNPDFITSAQALTYILPERISCALGTPLDGSEETWIEFLRVNKQVVDAMVNTYEARGMKDFVILTGINFSPYSNADFLKTQTIKAAHMHSFLISKELLEQVSFFSSKKELRMVHEVIGTPKSDISRDLRRFFAGPISRAFSQLVLDYAEKRLSKEVFSQLAEKQILFSNKSGEYPMSAIIYNVQGIGILESQDFLKMMKVSYQAFDDFYRQFLMPVFTSNYHDVVPSAYPESKRLEYHTPETALEILSKTMVSPIFSDLSDDTRGDLRKTVEKLARRLDKDKPEALSLGHSVAYTVLYKPKTGSVTIYIVCGPFGGGSVESLGINKVPITKDEQNKLFDNYYSNESSKVEAELDEAIRSKLS